MREGSYMHPCYMHACMTHGPWLMCVCVCVFSCEYLLVYQIYGSLSPSLSLSLSLAFSFCLWWKEGSNYYHKSKYNGKGVKFTPRRSTFLCPSIVFVCKRKTKERGDPTLKRERRLTLILSSCLLVKTHPIHGYVKKRNSTLVVTMLDNFTPVTTWVARHGEVPLPIGKRCAPNSSKNLHLLP